MANKTLEIFYIDWKEVSEEEYEVNRWNINKIWKILWYDWLIVSSILIISLWLFYLFFNK